MVPSMEKSSLFKAVRTPDLSDLVARQIRTLVVDGKLLPGEKLPSERELASRFEVGRGYVRSAIQKLEFYGLVKTYPQRGTIVEGVSNVGLRRLCSDMLGLEEMPLAVVSELRKILEVNAARLAAQRASKEDASRIRRAWQAHGQKVEAGGPAMSEDSAFHNAIAKASGNPMLAAFIQILSEEIINLTIDYDACRDSRPFEAMKEHEAVLRAIEAGDAAAAGQAMNRHLSSSDKQYGFEQMVDEVKDRVSVAGLGEELQGGK
jgi:GntR family transcriptional regulator, transcriptional repressor for pyruvate dehydrogenase complex